MPSKRTPTPKTAAARRANPKQAAEQLAQDVSHPRYAIGDEKIHGGSDILSIQEAIAALGACCSAFATFLQEGEPAEIRWLAEVLQERNEDQQNRIDDIAENHISTVRHVYERYHQLSAEIQVLKSRLMTQQPA
jgi:hypothetical protein